MSATGPDLSDDELVAWLRLLATPSVGRDTARRLLAAFGGPAQALAADETARRRVAGAAVAAALNRPPEGFEAQCQATQAWRRAAGAAAPRRLMVLGDADYPEAWLNTADPPLLLYLEGRAELLRSARTLAIVGSRKPTPQGRDNARQFAATLAQQGWVIVSGLAAGIDGAAHEGALQAGGDTVAVIGTGIDIAYPASHRGLARRIAEHGLLVSELPLGAPPLAAHFPQRNRLIAGLARGTLVVEAALRSGSLITARLAAEAGREVYALPGSVLSAQSEGCHELIRQGATLVGSAAQLLQELDGLPAWPEGAAPGPALPLDSAEATDPVLRALGLDPCSLDALMARCGWPAPQLSAHLLTLELSGQIARLPGGLFQRIHSG